MSNSSPMSAPFAFPSEEPAPACTQGTQEWKRAISQALESHRAHRSGRAQPAMQQQPARPSQTAAQDRAARIAAAVAARYAVAPTYTELFQQPDTAQTEAVADAPQCAAAPAQIGPAQMRAISADPLQNGPQAPPSADAPLLTGQQSSGARAHTAAAPKDAPVSDAGSNAGMDADGEFHLEPRPVPVSGARIVLPKLPRRTAEIDLHLPAKGPEPALEDLLASAVVTPPTLLPANLIEFPRELVAERRVRPQRVEGPLGTAHRASMETSQVQLRIFEVGPEDAQGDAVEMAPATSLGPGAPTGPIATAETAHPTGPTADPAARSTWSSIRLDARPTPGGPSEADLSESLPVPLQPASIDRRLMALAVDFCLVTSAFLAFLFVFALSTPHLPAGKAALVTGAVVYLALWVLYQVLFFSLSDATAGMRYAHIALCTFEDENPCRRAMQRRLAVWWISILPLGLGLVWALFDEDSLCWHDKITRMYQRSYE